MSGGRGQSQISLFLSQFKVVSFNVPNLPLTFMIINFTSCFIQGVKARMFGRQSDRNFCYDWLALTSIFGLCFMSVFRFSYFREEGGGQEGFHKQKVRKIFTFLVLMASLNSLDFPRHLLSKY